MPMELAAKRYYPCVPVRDPDILPFHLRIIQLCPDGSNTPTQIPIIILFSVLCILILYFGASLMIADPTDSVIRVKYDT